MDFIIGIIFVLLTIFIIINYTTISISNNNNTLKDVNYLYTKKNNVLLNNTMPLPRQQNKSINNKLNLEEQSYDYKSYFYI
jgi:hypothetical protein